MSKTCGTCALQKQNGGICPLFGEHFEDHLAACPKHQEELKLCDVCGAITLDPILNLDDNKYWCSQCQTQKYHCVTCNRGKECVFQTDPSPIPKIINKEIRQGNMIAVTQIPNPERVEKTCKINCACFDAKLGCLKQNNYCEKWRPAYEEV
jgi:hypothetical protein